MIDLLLIIMFFGLAAVFAEWAIREITRARLKVLRAQSNIDTVVKNHTETLLHNRELQQELVKTRDERDDLKHQSSRLEEKVQTLQVKLEKTESAVTWEFIATNYRANTRGQSSKSDTVMAMNETDARYLAQRRYPATQGWEVSNFKHKRTS